VATSKHKATHVLKPRPNMAHSALEVAFHNKILKECHAQRRSLEQKDANAVFSLYFAGFIATNCKECCCNLISHMCVCVCVCVCTADMKSQEFNANVCNNHSNSILSICKTYLLDRWRLAYILLDIGPHCTNIGLKMLEA
jgi:hypothetical protein